MTSVANQKQLVVVIPMGSYMQTTSTRYLLYQEGYYAVSITQPLDSLAMTQYYARQRQYILGNGGNDFESLLRRNHDRVRADSD